MTSTTTDGIRPRTTACGPLTIAYDDRVLTPRAWTTVQSAWAADLLDHLPAGPVLELFTGAGHIGLLALTLRPRPAVLVDVSPVACAYARRNAAAAGLDVEVREARIEEAVGDDEVFALVIADPPYLPSAGVDAWPDDPVLAIDGGVDGLALVRSCLEVVDECLAPDGAALLQLSGPAQAHEVDEWLRHHAEIDLGLVEIRTDPRGAVVLLRRRTGTDGTAAA